MWRPETEDQIRIAIQDGNLYESTHLDVKREIGDSPSARKETAKDLSSFAIEGGALLIGVDEDTKNRTFTLSPIDLTSAVERVEQIIATRLDPPLFARIREIPASTGNESGYLFVEVPPSPEAPHMVDGVYYARGDRTTRRLTDAQVAMLHRLREHRGDVADRLLDEEIARDPFEDKERQRGVLYLVAEPLTGPVDLAVRITRGGPQPLHDIVANSDAGIPQKMRGSAPNPGYASRYSQRSRGAAYSSLENGRTVGPEGDAHTFDAEVRDSGGVRVLSGRLTEKLESGFVVFDGLAVAHTIRLVNMAARISEKSTYRGAWAFGIAGDRLRGLEPYSGDFGTRGTTYDVDLYRQTATAYAQELQDRPLAVARRLVGPLLRGLGTEARYDREIGWAD